MLPEIAEIVLIKKALPLAEVEGGEGNLLWVGRKLGAAGTADTIFFTADQEAVEMGVAPVEGDLDGVVKVNDAVGAANEEATPTGGLGSGLV